MRAAAPLYSAVLAPLLLVGEGLFLHPRVASPREGPSKPKGGKNFSTVIGSLMTMLEGGKVRVNQE